MSLGLIALCFLTACGGGEGTRFISKTKEQFLAQIDQSCSASLREYEKQVISLEESDGATETKRFDDFGQVVVGENQQGEDSLGCELFQELEYALKEEFEDPFLADLYTVTEHQDTLRAEILPEESGNQSLQFQEIVKGENGETVRYLHSRYLTENLLYRLSAEIIVWFDVQGRYQQHTLTIRHKVAMLGSSVNARIEGKAIYTDE